MNKRQSKPVRPWPTLALMATCLLSGDMHATVPIGEAGSAVKEETEWSPFDRRSVEEPVTRWALAFDNDMLVPSSRDQDYTYGLSFTRSGGESASSFLSMHGPLGWIDRHLGIPEGNGASARHSIEFGIYGFTPEDISLEEANPDDRPYASLLYLSSSKSVLGSEPGTAWFSSLTVGILGLDFIGDLQNGVHRLIDTDEAMGWDHQVSDGGELTARYSLARQRLWAISSPKFEVKSSVQASVGYLTEVSWSINLRAGRIDSEWREFNPELASYRERASRTRDDSSGNESYFSAGIALKARLYNVFLQGQFRSSDVSYDFDQLNHGIVEAWAGYTHAFKSGYRLSYFIRGHTSEVRQGGGDRNVVWGGLVLAKVF